MAATELSPRIFGLLSVLYSYANVSVAVDNSNNCDNENGTRSAQWRIERHCFLT